MAELPAFAHALCDDAAMFPPGLAPLPDALTQHRNHRAAAYSGLVGPLVLDASALTELSPLLTSDEGLQLTITAPQGSEQLADALSTATSLSVEITAAEVAVPGDPAEFFTELARVAAPGVPVFVEVPRDERRADVITGCAEHGHQAKLRTGGVRAELYPDETELAASINAVTRTGVSFKATAGLHHAVRNTDPETGFEQHGFLNLLLATDAALRGDDENVSGLLANRDGTRLATALHRLAPARVAPVRQTFVSFGTCSIAEPLTELMELDLIPAAFSSGQGGYLSEFQAGRCSRWVRASAAWMMLPILLGLAVMRCRVRQRPVSRANPRSPRLRSPRNRAL